MSSTQPVLPLRNQRKTMLRIKRILVPVDFSEHAENALLHARELAITYRAHMDLLHIIEEPTFPAMYGAMMKELYGELPNVNAQALGALQNLLSKQEGTDVASGLHVVKGSAAKEILQFATAHDIDLIVMASHGLTGLKGLLMGSVAEKILREAPCPVFIVKAFGKSLITTAGAEEGTDE